MESILSYTGSNNVSIKLLIGAKSQRVIYAEAGKDFIDFLFSITLLPLGSVTRLLSQNGMVGCLGKLYSTIENFSDTNMQPPQKKENLLKPTSITLDTEGRLLTSQPYTILACPLCATMTVDKYVLCPHCHSTMKREMKFVPRRTLTIIPSDQEEGFVKGITYLITDDLEVKPMSTLSSMTLLKNYDIKADGGLEEKVVNLDKDMCLKLLKASLHSNTVLTDVFLVKSNGAQPSATKRKVEQAT